MKNNKIWTIIILLFILTGCEIEAGTYVEYNTETGVVNVSVSEYQNNIEALAKQVDGGMGAIKQAITENVGFNVEFVITPKSEYRIPEAGSDVNDYTIKFSFNSIEEYNDFMSSKINDQAVTVYDGLLIYAFSPNSEQFLKTIIDETIKDLEFSNSQYSNELIEMNHTFSVSNQVVGVWEIGSHFPRQDQVFDRHIYAEYKRDFWGKLKPETVNVEFVIDEDIDIKIIEELKANSFTINRVETGYKVQQSYDATTNIMQDFLANIFYEELNEIQFYGFLDIDCSSNLLLKIYNITQCSKATDNIKSKNIQGDELEYGFILPNISGINVYGDFEVHYIIDGNEAIISDQSIIEILGVKRVILCLIPLLILLFIVIYGLYRKNKERDKYPLS